MVFQGCSIGVLGVLWKFHWRFRGNYNFWMFDDEWWNNDSKIFQCLFQSCLKVISWIFQVRWVFQECLERLSRVFQGCFKGTFSLLICWISCPLNTVT